MAYTHTGHCKLFMHFLFGVCVCVCSLVCVLMQRLGGRGPFPHAMLLPNDGAESFAPRARDSGDDGVRMQKCSVTWKWFMQNAPRRCRDECVLYMCVCVMHVRSLFPRMMAARTHFQGLLCTQSARCACVFGWACNHNWCAPKRADINTIKLDGECVCVCAHASNDPSKLRSPWNVIY